MCNAHRLRNLDEGAIVQVQLVALMQLVTVFVVGVAEEVAGLVVDHDAIVERVELKKAILPSLLLAADILGEETAELGNGRAVLGGGDGSDGGGVRGAAERSRHGTGRWTEGAAACVYGIEMEAGLVGGGGWRAQQGRAE